MSRLDLFDVHDQIEVILAREVDQETGEITDDTLAQLTALELDRNVAALALARYVMSERSEAEAVKAQAERLATRARGHEARATRLLGWLESHLPAGERLEDDVVQIRWRTAQAVEVVDDWRTALPDRFIRISESQAPDKKALGEALKGGEKIPGAVLVKRTRVNVK